MFPEKQAHLVTVIYGTSSLALTILEAGSIVLSWTAIYQCCLKIEHMIVAYFSVFFNDCLNFQPLMEKRSDLLLLPSFDPMSTPKQFDLLPAFVAAIADLRLNPMLSINLPNDFDGCSDS